MLVLYHNPAPVKKFDLALHASGIRLDHADRRSTPDRPRIDETLR